MAPETGTAHPEGRSGDAERQVSTPGGSNGYDGRLFVKRHGVAEVFCGVCDASAVKAHITRAGGEGFYNVKFVIACQHADVPGVVA